MKKVQARGKNVVHQTRRPSQQKPVKPSVDKTPKAPKVSKVESIALGTGKKLYMEKDGLRVTTRGRTKAPVEVLQAMPKGERRRVRKWMVGLGRRDLALASIPSKVVDGLHIRKLTAKQKKDYLDSYR
jgi:hypothetical protein